MKKIKPIASLYLIVIFILVSVSLFAQENSSSEIIVEGNSKTKVKPDLVTFTLTVERSDTSEKKVLEKLNSEVDNLTKTLYKIGFTNNTIKIDDYSIYKSYIKRKKTYTASNVLKIEFLISTKLINGLYKEIQDANSDDVDISYETNLSDSLEKSTRRYLVQQSLTDAELNANNIAKTLNLKIIGVKQVSKSAPEFNNGYSFETNKLAPPKTARDEEIEDNTSFEKFQVEDIELEEGITIIYEISKS